MLFLVQVTFNDLDTLDHSDLVHKAVKILYILDIKADITLENSIVALDVNLADIDVEFILNQLCQVEDDTNAVNASQFYRREV